MSLISRLFRRPPPAGQPPTPAPPVAPAGAADGAGAAVTASVPDPAVLAAQRAAEEEAALTAALDAADQAALSGLVVTGSTTRIRQRAAQAITDPSRLRELIRSTRGGKDNQVYRILTAKRDAMLAEQRSAERLTAEIEAASAAIERHSLRPFDVLFIPTLEQLESRWGAVAASAPPELRDQVNQHLARAREVIERHREQLDAEAARKRAAATAADEERRRRAAEREAAAAALAEKARAEEAERLAQIERQRAEEAALRTIVSLARRALAALERGSSARAARLRSLVVEQLPAAPALPGWVARLLQQLDDRLAELKDWKTFTVGPKRVELIQAMESLIGSTLPRPELARRIKELQTNWRTLGRGAGDAGDEGLEADRLRFREAGARAYEPCRLYFEQQAELRRENARRREELLESLRVFTEEQNVENPNWRRIGQTLEDARRQWRRHSPVDRACVAALEERFQALTGALRDRLNAEYERNVKEKRTLIERAQALVSEPDTRASIESVKNLQRRWQAVGLVPREEDGALWAAFRQHCDAVFARREQESAAYRESLETNRARGAALCETVEGIASLSGPKLLDAAAGLETLRGEFEALELPRSATRALRERFARAAERCAAAVTRERALETRRIWSDVLAAANCLRAYALAVARPADPAERAALRARTEAAIAARRDWPKDAGAVLARQLSRADAGEVPADLAANEALLRRLCIRAEVLSDIPTPPEDAASRREYQLQRLVRTMGQGASADPEELDTLALEWIAAGPVEEETYVPLLSRFERCRDALGSRPG